VLLTVGKVFLIDMAGLTGVWRALSFIGLGLVLVGIGYLYQRLKSEDFYYNGLQTGFTPTSVLPTNQTAPSYSVGVIYASFTHEF